MRFRFPDLYRELKATSLALEKLWVAIDPLIDFRVDGVDLVKIKEHDELAFSLLLHVQDILFEIGQGRFPCEVFDVIERCQACADLV